MQKKEFFELCKSYDPSAINSEDRQVAGKCHNDRMTIESLKNKYPDIYLAFFGNRCQKIENPTWSDFMRFCYFEKYTEKSWVYIGPFWNKKDAIDHARRSNKGEILIYEAVDYVIELTDQAAKNLQKDIQDALINAVLTSHGEQNPKVDQHLEVRDYGIKLSNFVSRVEFSDHLFTVGELVCKVPPANCH